MNFPNFKTLQKEMIQEKVFKNLKTLVIDIENTLISRIEISNSEELYLIKL